MRSNSSATWTPPCVSYRESLGLELRFQSPSWTEFETGQTTLALHPASEDNPAGSVQLGLGTTDIDNFYAAAQAEGLVFTSLPTDVYGSKIARFRDLDGAEISVSGG
jgi:lactoylglutathione lyase